MSPKTHRVPAGSGNVGFQPTLRQFREAQPDTNSRAPNDPAGVNLFLLGQVAPCRIDAANATGLAVSSCLEMFREESKEILSERD